MPKKAFNPKAADAPQFTLLPDGDYCYEVTSINVGIRNSGKTNGSEEITMKLAFYEDATFTKKMGQFSESLIFHDSIAWKIDAFTKSAGMLVDGQVPGDGVEVDYSTETMIGLRGWATVSHEQGMTDKTKTYNRVKAWISNKELLPRNVPAEDDCPF